MSGHWELNYPQGESVNSQPLPPVFSINFSVGHLLIVLLQFLNSESEKHSPKWFFLVPLPRYKLVLIFTLHSGECLLKSIPQIDKLLVYGVSVPLWTSVRLWKVNAMVSPILPLFHNTPFPADQLIMSIYMYIDPMNKGCILYLGLTDSRT